MKSQFSDSTPDETFKSSQKLPRLTFLGSLLPILILICNCILIYLALIQPWLLQQAGPPVQVGDVAQEDFLATRDIQYVSHVRTEEARTAAEREVAPVYTSQDPTVARGQVEKLISILSQITAIISDQKVSDDQKKIDLANIQNITLQPTTIDSLLALSPSRWDLVQSEALSVLENVMQNPIRTEDLVTVSQNISPLVGFSLSERETTLVVEFVSSLIVANSFYSPELTADARQTARTAVQPITQSYIKGQMVVSSGQIITEADFEALTELELIEPEDQSMKYVGASALVVLAAIFMTLYFSRRQSILLRDLRSLTLLSILFLIFLLVGRLVVPNRTVIPYIFPLPAFGLLVSALFGMESGMVFSLLISILAAYGLPNSQSLMPYYIVTSLCGVLALGRARRVGQFLFAAGMIAVAGGAIIIAYRLPFTNTDWVGIATLFGAAAFNGIASPSIALPLQYVLAQFVGLTTALQLLEISRPDFPLLKYFLQRAPGTYQHSLQVANLAEQAAESIGADGLLTRVGALFHDIGKAANPLFFIENQPPQQIDSHDNLDPARAAIYIIDHVKGGLRLAKKFRLPRRILDFILEHHGTLITRYQYNQALEAANGNRDLIDTRKFRYTGPTPNSRETGILMLADGVEARARAERPQNDVELRTIVSKVIERVQTERQLDNTPLTQRDLLTITESFVKTLRVTYHPRLEYPQEVPESHSPASEEIPAATIKVKLKKNK